MDTNSVLKKNIDQLSIVDMKKFLKDVGSYHSFKSKTEYKKRIKCFKDITIFPWRKDQLDIINNFLEYKHKIYVIHAIFGSGKTTIMLGSLILALINKIFKPTDAMFISFNISTKNEIKRKLKDFGIASKVNVRTFDSIIYEIAKIAKYPYIDLPNFEGKRKFVYELIFNKFEHKLEYQPDIIYIDECQDLEKQTLDILKYFYPNTKFFLAGDIFQSIQKEARESILWHYMMLPENPEVFKIYMYDTPRVPNNNLNTLKKALTIHYPEFKDKINNWKSSNIISESDIEWKRFNSYTHIYDDLKNFLSTHKPEETMILTFSSSITVKGAMGDIARLRRFLNENGFKVNTNHKKQEPENYFLSTAHSCKGLERDYVIVFLTFPLEKAFVHLSDDVVVNLITVALTRAKKKVIMYVPSYEDKYSRVLNLFENCPSPNKERIRTGKILNEFSFKDYVDNEHCPTELIRAGVIKYDTRIALKSFTKKFSTSKIFNDIKFKVMPIITDEERSFVGILIENLITSTWTSKWPEIELHNVKDHPFYTHIIKRITNSEKNYRTFIHKDIFNVNNQFDGIYIYSQIHVALSDKVFIKLSDTNIKNLKQYWSFLKPQAILMKPNNNNNKLKIQSRLKMPYIAGVADALTEDDDNKTTSIYEIKASQDRNWVDNALLQIIIYALMTGKTWSRLHLLNPFQNTKESYYFDSKNILSLRKELLKDVIVWNVNTFFAKTYPSTKINENKIDVSNILFLDIIKDNTGNITQASITNMLSPIKCEYIYSQHVTFGEKKEKKMTKQEKIACESNIDSKKLIDELKNIINSEMYKNKIIYSLDKHDDIKEGIISIKSMHDLNGFEDIVTYLNYSKNEDLSYSADLNDSLTKNVFTIAYMFQKNQFI